MEKRDIGILATAAVVLFLGLVAFVIDAGVGYEHSVTMDFSQRADMVEKLRHGEAVGIDGIDGFESMFAWALEPLSAGGYRLPAMADLELFGRKWLDRGQSIKPGDVVVLGKSKRESLGVVASADESSLVVLHAGDSGIIRTVLPYDSPLLWETGALKLLRDR